MSKFEVHRVTTGVLSLWLVLGVAVSPGEAHNGEIAIVTPVKEIVVDGDLSDWSEDMIRYPILLTEFGNRPQDTKDFTGFFRVGYNMEENALYIAVEVQDEAVVVDTTASWDTQDGCEVYVDIEHKEKDSPAVQYAVWGNARRMREASGPISRWTDEVMLKIRRTERRHQYEWRIDIGSKSKGQVHLHPGMVLGFDVVINDKDPDGLSWMAWGKHTRKFQNTEARGDVVLVGPETGIGYILGQVKWEGEERGVPRRKVRIQSVEVPGLWVQVETDRQGVYKAYIPAGRYQVGVIGFGEKEKKERMVEVQEGRAEEVDLFVKPSTGAVVKAGNGRTVKAGTGTQQGYWRTFDVSDGLPIAAISCILQDRKGNLWYGSYGGGVIRYDGEYFSTFTAKDGLASDQVMAILEDRSGQLWFGTEGEGVSRYDGEQFTTFTTQEGLASNVVTCMLEDRSGQLWFGTDGGISRYDEGWFTTFTTQDGLASNIVNHLLEDRSGKLWFGTSGGVSRYDGEQFTTFTTQEGLASNIVNSMLEDKSGQLWFGTDGGGVSRYDGERFITFTAKDGLASDIITRMAEDRSGQLWFGTWGEGVSRYDGERFTTFTAQDGLASGRVKFVLEDRSGQLWFGTWGGVSRYDGERFTTFTTQEGLGSELIWAMLESRSGQLWFGTWGGGVSRYDGERFTTFTTRDGLVSNVVNAVLEDRSGQLWFGTSGGVSRYDGKRFTTFTTQEGLANNNVVSMLEDRSGQLWFGTDGGGVSRYDGERFTTFTTQDGLVSNVVNAVLEDRSGQLWFGTLGGVSRYDGERFATFTTQDGLGNNSVVSMLEDHSGQLWFGTWGGGISRYDGERFTTSTIQDGLVDNIVTTTLEDRSGQLWFGSRAGGISRYDGLVFQNLLRQDGLADNRIRNVLQDHKGDIWIATEKGLTRYHPHQNAPPIYIVDVVADRRYGPIREIHLPSSQEFLAFDFKGISFKTRQGQIVYLYQLEGYDTTWRQTRERRVEYTNLPRGNYVFRVKAVDSDLTYSEVPAEVLVQIHLPYGRIALGGGLGMALIAVAIASGYAVRRRRERDQTQRQLLTSQKSLLETQTQLVETMEKELQMAHDVQMSLLPQAAPAIAGFDIAGRCIPANHVGGDHYTYIWLNAEQTKLAIVIADVSGHEMKAAMMVMRFAEMLHYETQGKQSSAEILKGISRSAYGRLDRRMFVTACIGVLDIAEESLEVASAGHPPVYHRLGRSGEVMEVGTSGYPLRGYSNGNYSSMKVDLKKGDALVFYTDGTYEASNKSGEQYGFERLARKVQEVCGQGCARESIERILTDVERFSENAQHEDDMTVVVVKLS